MFQTETGASCKLPSPFVVYGDRAGSRTDILFYCNDIEVGINLGAEGVSFHTSLLLLSLYHTPPAELATQTGAYD